MCSYSCCGGENTTIESKQEDNDSEKNDVGSEYENESIVVDIVHECSNWGSMYVETVTKCINFTF
jgi:hypothetical protein